MSDCSNVEAMLGKTHDPRIPDQLSSLLPNRPAPLDPLCRAPTGCLHAAMGPVSTLTDLVNLATGPPEEAQFGGGGEAQG